MSGFKDIEWTSEDGRVSRFLSSRACPVGYPNEKKAQYYRDASRYSWFGEFLAGEQQVWSLHAEGVAVAGICAQTGRSYRFVVKTIKKHRKKISEGPQSWDPEWTEE
jgi:hypothetical protein